MICLRDLLLGLIVCFVISIGLRERTLFLCGEFQPICGSGSFNLVVEDVCVTMTTSVFVDDETASVWEHFHCAGVIFSMALWSANSLLYGAKSCAANELLS